MGKEELNNIKKMYLLRMHTNKKYAIIVFWVAIVFALVDILSMVINFSTEDVFYLNLNRNSVALFWVVILVLVITSFNIGEYKKQLYGISTEQCYKICISIFGRCNNLWNCVIVSGNEPVDFVWCGIISFII